MAARKPLIPFNILPFTWGMKGKTRDIAHAEYYLSDYELDMRLNEINLTGTELANANLATKRKWDKISEYEFDVGFNQINLTGKELENASLDVSMKYAIITKQDYDVRKVRLNGTISEIAEIEFQHGLISEKDHDYKIAEIRNDEGTWLGVKHKHGDMSDNEFLKEMATLRNEPWVGMVSMDLDPSSANMGSFEMDWNDLFIETIKKAGYVGRTEEDCVDLWFTDVSKNIALAELTGTGIFDEQADRAYVLKKKRLNGGKTEYK